MKREDRIVCLPTGAIRLSQRLGAIAVYLSSIAWACHRGDAANKNGDPVQGQRVQYQIHFVPGGIDRVILTKRDEARNLCVQVTLVSPEPVVPSPPAGAVKAPPGWTVDRAIAVPDANACHGTPRRNPPAAIAATEVTGSVSWGASPTEGTAVDLRLSFPARAAEPAFTERFSFTR